MDWLDAVEPPEERPIPEGYEWSPKDDDYWDMKFDERRDNEDEERFQIAQAGRD